MRLNRCRNNSSNDSAATTTTQQPTASESLSGAHINARTHSHAHINTLWSLYEGDVADLKRENRTDLFCLSFLLFLYPVASSKIVNHIVSVKRSLENILITKPIATKNKKQNLLPTESVLQPICQSLLVCYHRLACSVNCN